MTLSWSAITGASKYRVMQYENGICTILTDELTLTTYDVTGLEPGKTCYFIVNSYVDSEWSATGGEYIVSGAATE